ncbi:hypothetical protein Pan153_01350 [Gimesia panareensis]|uniref:DUF3592 domain-containing protein n=1 Tax=Gimesia panareensis TaxID=2527978 RepID=A0A518FGR2_9PLAN|nr:DUF3592 domain-containing protein [Gimesia panareensis]QDV15521.1 hypothetical protein Pan153_01350 [Gimesia panareensis]
MNHQSIYRTKTGMHQVGRKLVLFIGFVFIFVGYLMAYQKGLPLLERAKASKEWPTTDGVVLESKIESHHSSNSSSSTYSPKVIYRYEVEGQEFKGDTVWFGNDVSTSDRSMSSKTVKKYPVQKNVTVYYDPAEPAVAVLEPGVFKTTYFFYLFGWLFLGLGLLMTSGILFRSLLRLFRGPTEIQQPAESAD